MHVQDRGLEASLGQTVITGQTSPQSCPAAAHEYASVCCNSKRALLDGAEMQDQVWQSNASRCLHPLFGADCTRSSVLSMFLLHEKLQDDLKKACQLQKYCNATSDTSKNSSQIVN